MEKFIVLIAAICGVIRAMGIEPQVDYQPRWYAVDDVEAGSEGTRVGVTFTNLPGFWCRLDSSTVLVDRATGKEYAAIGAEGMTLGDHVFMPASGKLGVTIIFEPLPKEAQIVDLIEKSNSNPEDVTYGIRLGQQRLPLPERQSVPMLDAPDGEGFDAGRYRDMDFVKPGGAARIMGKIDNYAPQLGYSVLKITSYDNLNNKSFVTVADLDSVGAFEAEVPLTHPQRIMMEYGKNYSWIFIMPGDTLEYTTTTRRKFTNSGLEPAYSLYGGCESAKMNVAYDAIADSVSRYVMPYGAWPATFECVDSVLAVKDRMAGNVRGAIGYLNRTLPMMDIPQWQKDWLFTTSLISVYLPIEDMCMYYRDKQYNYVPQEDGYAKREVNPGYVPIDESAYYAGMRDFIDLVYDNPLVLCGDWIILNRAAFSPLFLNQNIVAEGVTSIDFIDGEWRAVEETIVHEGESRTDRLRMYDERRRGALGIGPCFVSELLMAQSLTHRFSIPEEGLDNPLDVYCGLASDLMPMLTHKALIRNVIDVAARMSYENGVKEGGAGAGADESRHISEASDVLAEIVEPYKGDVVYVDVWAYWCGPCRSGILGMKDLVKQYAEKPFKVVYVAEDTGKAQCEHWLNENEIEGERVYLSTDAYARLSADFNISGIPFGILIGKDGKIADTGHVRMSIGDERLNSLLGE